MKKNHGLNPISYAVALAIAAETVSSMAVAQVQLEEVVVTATKREESAQDIPITIQAIGEGALEEMNITNFEDYIKNLPGVTAGGRGPGRQNVYIRGVSTGKGGIKIAGAVGSEPNVAFYLDEAPISIGGRNLDPYLVDIKRVEVLPGPQGTLFGASSQAGTIRVITNKPVINDEHGGFTISASKTAHGELSNAAQAYFNVPLIEDKLAARIALYNVKEGGYIDNVEATKQISVDNPAFVTPPADRAIISNTNFSGDDFNDALFQGFRGGLTYALNDNIEILLQHTHQELETEGVWDYEPALGDLKVQTFSPDKANDLWDLTAWTATSRFEKLSVIYTGSYLDREFEGVQDYSGYADVGPFIPYYICSYPGYASCGTPNLSVKQFFGVERSTHEVRLNSNNEHRLRWIVGVYKDKTTIIERGDWIYPATIEQGFAPNAPFTGATSSNPNTRPLGVAFFNDFERGKKELSFFGELEFDITDSLTATIGKRHYDLELSLVGSSNFGQRGTDGDAGANIDMILLGQSPADFSDSIYKANLQWQINSDVMIYTTWSEGYRPGGFNRNGGFGNQNATIPYFYGSDELTNMELGWKTQILERTLRLNGALYFLQWDKMQVTTIDFNISNLAFIDNTTDAEIKGLEMDLSWLATNTLSVFFNLSYNDTELIGAPQGIVNISPQGSPLALAPELQYTFRVRNDWAVDAYTVFAQFGGQYTDGTTSSIIIESQFPQDSYSTFDASVGFEHSTWTIALFIENITDERAQLYINNEDNVDKIATNRPLTAGLRFSYKTGK